MSRLHTTVGRPGRMVENFASIVLHAGQRVRLTQGFSVKPGGYFRAEIGACDTTAVAP